MCQVSKTALNIKKNNKVSEGAEMLDNENVMKKKNLSVPPILFSICNSVESHVVQTVHKTLSLVIHFLEHLL